MSSTAPSAGESREATPVVLLRRGDPGSRALVVVLLAWVAYVISQTLVVTEHLSEVVGVLIGLVLGAVGVAALLAAGRTTASCYLRPGRLSLRGALALLPIVLVWPLVLATGQYTGPDPGGAAVGVFGSVAQELFFRSALLPGLMLLTRPRTALVIHTVAFGIWHGGALLAAPDQMGGAIAIIVVSLGAGYAWGWQTLRDRTVIWAMAHHSLLWIAGSFFDLSPPS